MKINVEFEITDTPLSDSVFLQQLDSLPCIGKPDMDGVIIGYRAGDTVQRREALTKFVNEMELKLRKNEHKKNWRDKPIEALFKLLLLEIEEFKVAHEFFSVGEAATELVDVANFAMMVHDRLLMMDQERNLKEQETESERLFAHSGNSRDWTKWDWTK